MNKTETISKTITVMVLAMFALSLTAAFVATDSEADSSSKLSYFSWDGNINVEANGTGSTTIYLTNYYDDTRIVNISCSIVGDELSVSADPSSFSILPHSDSNSDPKAIKLTVSAGKYASKGTYTLTMTITHVNLKGGDKQTDTYTKQVSVSSDLSSDDAFNKFLGYYPNPLDAPFNSPIFTAAISFLILTGILYLLSYLVVPPVCKLLTKLGNRKGDKEDHKDAYRKLKNLIQRLVNVAIFMYALTMAMKIYGLSEEFIDLSAVIFHVLYIILGAVVIWNVFVVVVDLIIEGSNKTHMAITGEETSSIDSARPLFHYIGKIVISVVAVMMIMSRLGFDLGAIITGAGIVSLGITLGAQSVLSQFFSGLVLLSTRPFKKGDYLNIGSDPTVYKVKKVNIMNTELGNWDNTDVTIVPNSALTSAFVKNITRETNVRKIHLFMTVAYGTDLDFARELMLRAAAENPRVIKDPDHKPSTRVTDFQDSNIELRLSVYVDSFDDSGSIGGELRSAMYNLFNEHNVVIDYNQIVLHVAPDSIDQFH